VGSDTLLDVLRGIILTRVEKDTLVIPSLPEVASKCLELLRHDEVDLREVAKLIERDPVLATRLLRQATSAAMGGEGHVNIQQATTRLGSKNVRTLILDASAAQLFRSRDQRIATAARQLWEHSLAVALLSRDLAAILGGGLDAEAAYLAGLVHDVGKPIAASMLLEVERASDKTRFKLNADTWLAVVQGVHRPIGIALAEKWRLPEAVAAAIRESTEYDSSERLSLGNVVCFSNSVAKLQEIYAGPFDKPDAEALIMLGRSLLGLEDDVIARLSNGLRSRVVGEFAA
jgi:putative nucleotidyltransferase with HDIG domain